MKEALSGSLTIKAVRVINYLQIQMHALPFGGMDLSEVYG